MSHANIAVFVPHRGCPQQCSFCNQHIISGAAAQPTAADVDRACEQAKKGVHAGDTVQLVDSGFLSGGVRISTRPDCIDDDVLSLLKAYGVRAVELGAQSMDDRVLSLNRRGHTAQDVVNASRLILSHGFELGLQMMTGLYGSTDEDSLETARQLIALRPTTARIYPTVVLKGTRLEQLYSSGEYQPPTLEQTVPLCSRLLQLFEENGVRVIRLGLHAQDDIERQMVAGAYHPALRELCQGEIYYRKALEQLQNRPSGDYQLLVSPAAVSQMTGQKKKNLLRLAQQGYRCRVLGDESLQSPYELKIKEL